MNIYNTLKEFYKKEFNLQTYVISVLIRCTDKSSKYCLLVSKF